MEDYFQDPTFYPEPSYPEPSTTLIIQHENTQNDQTPPIKLSLSRSHPKNIKSITARSSIVRTGDMKPEFCVICGSETKCYHYDVPSCDACKTFFRRSISTKKFYTCKFHQKCDYNAGDRCRSCRFDRCLMMGMNPEALVLPKTTDFEKFRTKIVKRKRTLEDQNQTILSKIRPTFEQTVYNKEIDGLVYLEFKLRRLRESSYNPTLEQGDIRSILQRPSELRNSDRYEKPRDWPISMEVHQQDLKLRMMNRSKGLFDDDVEKRHWLTIDLILVFEAAKTLPAFGMLDEDDKVV
uniref:Nuclear receptor domain-containing protein n=1 Tax=Acrobeloides nanus TaxID=290746 RepID=A0A914DN78_9BILA